MNFVRSTSHKYWWPVTVRLPNPDPDKAGDFLEQTFKMQFEPEGSDAAEERQKAYDTAKTVAEYSAAEFDHLRAICKNWSDIVEEDEVTPVPFTPENFDGSLKQVWFRRGVFAAYQESLSGEKARLGN
ncbi:hypothetical protein HB780_05440 (plasmid) [Rhizobium lusitanum]|uniref:hypothetical protein n=1 Tax=Rhizobium lusitanum TaxID=293958 RepID=UPI001611B8EE|nr:hypothetical protein [Rhizobium lusitanum]QND45199.1 hypothetical protein HB780_05440 [Rhizobium lusitanum]